MIDFINSIMTALSTDLLIITNGISELLKLILSGLLYFVIQFVYILFGIIDSFILISMPELSVAFTGIAVFLNIIGTSIGWVISMSGLSSATIMLIVSYYTFKLTAPMTIYFIKLLLSWYDKLKP